MKKTLIVSIVLVVAVLSLALTACSNGDMPKVDTLAGLENWMDSIENDTPLRRIAIPGSHDSGTVGMMSLAETQGASIKEQLLYGVRYFDIRVNGKGGKIFHGPVNGVPFAPIADDLRDFIKAHPSETLILDFQHFKNGGEKFVYDTIKSNGLLDMAVTKSDKNMSDIDFINSLTLSDVRGKVLVFFGNSIANDYDTVFLRNNDDCTRDGASLDSLYLGDEHKKGSEHFITSALPKYMAHIKDKNSGLLVLQGQLTAPNLMTSPLSLEVNHSDNMNKYTRAIKDNADDLKAVNIIMRDFVEQDNEKVLSILSLNIAKGCVKESALDAYTTLCSYIEEVV